MMEPPLKESGSDQFQGCFWPPLSQMTKMIFSPDARQPHCQSLAASQTIGRAKGEHPPDHHHEDFYDDDHDEDWVC